MKLRAVRRPWLVLAVLLVAVVVVVGSMWADRSINDEQADAVITVPQVKTAPLIQVAVIGDSYTGGSLMGGQEQESWVRKANVILGDDYNLLSQTSGGSGYVKRNPGGRTFPEMARTVDTDASLVVVFGSRNDTASRELSAATDDTYGIIRKRVPNAKLLVISPAWVDQRPTRGILNIATVIGTEAAKFDATYFDPIGARWFFDRPDLIGRDGVHPTDAGHEYMAERIAPLIKAQFQSS